MFKTHKEIHDIDGRLISLETNISGKALLNNPKLNKGSAFSKKERQLFGLTGMLPSVVHTLEQQMDRIYQQFKEKNSNLQKHIFLTSLHDNNETLFYGFVSKYLKEMLPIIYTPTIGEAVKKFSLEHRRSRGVYISYEDRNQIDEIIRHRSNDEIDLIVVTDGEGVLGLGDQGVGGINISIGKLMVYTLCAGIHPNRVLAVQLDVGTNNETLLNDPLYMGWRHKRIEGSDYDNFINKFVTTVKNEFSNVYLHWEDFGKQNARKNLNLYRNSICSFNDDIQGTGMVALASIFAGLRKVGKKLKDQVIVVLGAGTAGVGVVDQICSAMVQEGLTKEDAQKQFWLVDKQGLLVEGQNDLVFFQEPYLRKKHDIEELTCNDKFHITLEEVISFCKPTILIGCSTVKDAFTESVVKKMYQFCKQPIILPLSNPTSCCEADPVNLLEWTDGNALIATGSPFPPVKFKGKSQRIAQSNNAFVFPGLGLGVIVSKATCVTDAMLFEACMTLSKHSPINFSSNEALLPDYSDIKTVSHDIAISVAKQAIKDGVSLLTPFDNLERELMKYTWEPKYIPYTCPD